MFKKICLLLIFWIVFPTLFFAQAQGKEGKEEAITIVGNIAPKADENSYMVFAGQAKNNTKDLLHSVEIVFDVMDIGGKMLESTTAPITGKQEGILEGGEVGSFEVKTKVDIRTAGSYKYQINWKTFAK